MITRGNVYLENSVSLLNVNYSKRFVIKNMHLLYKSLNFTSLLVAELLGAMLAVFRYLICGCSWSWKSITKVLGRKHTNKNDMWLVYSSDTVYSCCCCLLLLLLFFVFFGGGKGWWMLTGRKKKCKFHQSGLLAAAWCILFKDVEVLLFVVW